MHLRKTIVLVALAAAATAPSALALRPPIDAGDPGPTILTWQANIHGKKVTPIRPCGTRQLQSSRRCVVRAD
jgi:hypothetical protein